MNDSPLMLRSMTSFLKPANSMYQGHIKTHSDQSDFKRQTSCAQTIRRPRIGLFDSGVGGLSVLRALQQELPGADYIYLGDTARLPYGQRSPETIVDYSMQASNFLHGAGVESIVIACNTASSVALGALQQAFTDTFVRGVVEAGAQAAADATQSGCIAVMGTQCTVESGAYEKAITRLIPDAQISGRACPFLVSLAEEGWTDCDIARLAIKKYLVPLFTELAADQPDCIILGCTHFSRFSSVIRELVGPGVTLIDPAHSMAQELSGHLDMRTWGQPEMGSVIFFATDALHRFASVGEIFLGSAIPMDSLERVDLDNL